MNPFEHQRTSKQKHKFTTHSHDGSGILYGEAFAMQEEGPDQSNFQKDRFRQTFYFLSLDQLTNELGKIFSRKVCDILMLARTFHSTQLRAENSENA